MTYAIYQGLLKHNEINHGAIQRDGRDGPAQLPHSTNDVAAIQTAPTKCGRIPANNGSGAERA